jgi:hypothetical protein
MRRLLTSVLLASGLTGCSLTLPVHGNLVGADETFSGSATGYPGSRGILEVTSSGGATCSGEFVYETKSKGSGIFRCDDGRTGPFQFVSTGVSGNGWGELSDNRTFVFSFGW